MACMSHFELCVPGVSAAFFANVYYDFVQQHALSPDEESEATESCLTLETRSCDRPVPSIYRRDLLSWVRWMIFRAGGNELSGRG